MTEIWAAPALWPSLALVATLLSIRLGASKALAEIVVIVMAQRPLGAIVATSVSGSEKTGLHSTQRALLTFLEEVGIREERVSEDRGGVAFYNLGRFIQLISDVETIRYHSKSVAPRAAPWESRRD